MTKRKYECNPTGKGEKYLAIEVILQAIIDYRKGRDVINHFGGLEEVNAAWQTLTQAEKKKGGRVFGDIRLTAYVMDCVRNFATAKAFLFPKKEYSFITELWTGLADMPIDFIQRCLKAETPTKDIGPALGKKEANCGRENK